MEILILMQDACAFCERAKQIAAKLASEYDLTVVTLDLGTAPGQALAEKGGVLFPPGVFLDGEPFSYGRLSERALRRAIQRKLGPPVRSS